MRTPAEAAIAPTTTLSPEDIARVALGCIEEKKAADVIVLNVGEQTILANYFIIATAGSRTQSGAIEAALRTELKRQGIQALSPQNAGDSQWVLLDLGAVIVHLFQAEARTYYDLESLWGDSPQVELEPIRPASVVA